MILKMIWILEPQKKELMMTTFIRMIFQRNRTFNLSNKRLLPYKVDRVQSTWKLRSIWWIRRSKRIFVFEKKCLHMAKSWHGLPLHRLAPIVFLPSSLQPLQRLRFLFGMDHVRNSNYGTWFTKSKFWRRKIITNRSTLIRFDARHGQRNRRWWWRTSTWWNKWW